MNKIRSWSPSRLFKYEQCPRSAKYDYVDSLCPQCFVGTMIWINSVTESYRICDTCDNRPEEPEAIVRGNEIHSAAELFIRKQRDDIDPRLSKVEGWLNFLRAEFEARRCRVELMLCLDKDWKMVDWKSKYGRLRVKLDVAWWYEIVAVCVIDWKSGKVKPKEVYSDQLEIYALAILSAKLASEAQAKLIFTDYAKEIPDPEGDVDIILEADLPKLQSKWYKRSFAMLNDERFEAKPGRHCNYCPYSRNKGGPCDY